MITINPTTPAIPKTVKSWLTSDYFKTQVALCLPKHLTADRFVRIAISALTRVPKLADCTPESVLKAMMTCSELGIEPDGRRAHLIPFNNSKLHRMECQLIVDYKGLVELAKRSGEIGSIHADVVCENDQFVYDRGLIETHKIDFRKPRGAMYAAYCIIRFKDSASDPKCEVMTKSEINAIRSRSPAGSSGPWVTDYNEMSKKTVFRRASKWIQLSPELHDALEKDGDQSPATASLVTEVPLSLPEAAEPSTGDDGDLGPVQETQPAPRRGRPPKVKLESAPELSGAPEQHVQDSLSEIVLGGGFSFSDFQKWGDETGNVLEAGSMAGFADVPTEIAKRLLRAKDGLLLGLENTRNPV